MMIGIDSNLNLVYEGSSMWGHALWPAPFLIPAVVKLSTEAALVPPRLHNLQAPHLVLFREDAFDPVSRIRRGRFYRAGQSQSMYWQVYPHPAMSEAPDQGNPTGTLRKLLLTFHSHLLANEIPNLGKQQLLVTLGSEESFSIWSVVGVEKIATSEELVTLKARQSIGVLPRLHDEAIPEAGREKVRAALDKLAEDMYRAGPESVADRAREAATAVLGVYLQERGIAKPGLDLGALIKKMEEDSKIVAANAANIVRLFHGRGKTAVQEKLAFRPLREQDAELAVQCVGTILCELEWADWV